MSNQHLNNSQIANHLTRERKRQFDKNVKK